MSDHATVSVPNFGPTEAVLSDTENPTDEQPQGDDGAGSDLKARLGLRTRKRRVSRPTGASLGGGSGDSNEFVAAPNDPTPLPQPLPQSSDDAAEFELPDGAGRLATKPLIVTLLIVAGVSLFLGSVLGGSLEQQGLREGHATYAEVKLKALTGAKTKSGAELISSLTAFQDAVNKAGKTLNEAKVAKTGADELRTETLKGFMAQVKAFADDDVYINPKRLMDDIMVLYPDDELLEAVKFAVKTRHLHDLASAVVSEARAYNRMAKGPFLAARIKSGVGGASKGVLIRHTEREIPELGKLPAAEGSWILDTGKPKKVKLVEKNRASNVTEQWEMMVVEVGKTAEQAVQVPTRDVMTLDMTSEYESHAELMQKLKLDRLEAMVTELKAVSDTIDWEDLKDKLQARAAEAP